MVFIFPLLIIIFICLLIAKLAGAAMSWGLVLLPILIVFILMLIFSMMGGSGKKKKRPAQSRDKGVAGSTDTDDNAS